MNSLELRNVSKSFPGVTALKNISLDFRPGEVHCLLGENGAGKSTLIKILAGHYVPDQGSILIDGVEKKFSSPKDAINEGIAVIHQELQLIPELSVEENICLGQWPVRRNIVDRRQMRVRALDALGQLNLNLDPTKRVSQLSTGQQQLVEIARALSRNAQVMILDEPTASLSLKEVDILLDIVRKLKAENLALLYVSHRMEEIFDIGDRLTVFRDGQVVDTVAKNEVRSDDIITMMVGRRVQSVAKKQVTLGEEALSVQGLTNDSISDISFSVYRGEVLGLGGLIGAGRSEVLRAIFGLDPLEKGVIKIGGKEVKFKHPADAINHGLGFVPEDRKRQGLSLLHSVKFNIAMSMFGNLSRHGWMNSKQETQLAQRYAQELRIATPSVDAPTVNLSGGNQQKVVLSHWLARSANILFLDEPTRGVDVGARAEIQSLIQRLVQEGVAIVLVSSDLEELLQLSDRVLIMRDGKILAERPANSLDKEEVLRVITRV